MPGPRFALETDTLIRRFVEAMQPVPHAVGGRDREVEPMLLVAGSVDHVLFTRSMLEREAHRERLYVVRFGVALDMGLASLCDRLGVGDILCTGKRKPVAELGGIGEIRRTELDVACAVTVPHAHRLHAVPVHVGRHRDVIAKDAQPLACDVRREHCFDHNEGDPWFAADTRDPAVARIETRVRVGPRGERGLRSVVTHAGAECQIAARTTDGIDLRVLVGRHRLLGTLSADPIGLFGHDDAEPTSRRG